MSRMGTLLSVQLARALSASLREGMSSAMSYESLTKSTFSGMHLSSTISGLALRTAAAAMVRWESSTTAIGTAATASLAEPMRRDNRDGEKTYAPPQNSTNSIFVDTLDMMKRFERLGVNREQAEALTHTLTEVMCSQRERLVEECASKAMLEKSEMQSQASVAGFRAEVMKSQELQAATFMRDTERLQANLEKVRSEIRYEIDKLTAAQRLDLNLEKGRMRDELQALRDKTNELEIKVDKEVNSLKAAMEQSKNDTVKYVLGLMLALMTAGLGAARLVMH